MMTVKQQDEESNSNIFAKEVIFGNKFYLGKEKKSPNEVNNIVHNHQPSDTLHKHFVSSVTTLIG